VGGDLTDSQDWIALRIDDAYVEWRKSAIEHDLGCLTGHEEGVA
jgi:hypothetical protein